MSTTSQSESLPYTIVDAFTDEVFGGNPAAVIILDESSLTKLSQIAGEGEGERGGGRDRVLQLIAREFNLSETAFITPRTDSKSIPESEFGRVATFGLRWFTPKAEVPLYGHATLASAYTLFSSLPSSSSPSPSPSTSRSPLPPNTSVIQFETFSGTVAVKRLQDGTVEFTETPLCGHATPASAHTSVIHFETLSGTLTAKKHSQKSGKIELEFPAGVTTQVGEELEKKAKEVVRRALAVAVAANEEQERNLDMDVDVVFVGVGEGISFGKYMLIELVSTFHLENATIDPGPLLDLAPDHTVITLTTKPASPSSSMTYLSRTFGPYVGVPEDPVTGSAHCMLGPYWHKRLGLHGLEVMKVHQVSERGGVLDVIWDQQRNTCRLVGEARVAMKGELFLPLRAGGDKKVK